MTTQWIEIGGKVRKVVLGAGVAATVDGVAVEADVRTLENGVISLLLTLPNGRVQSFRCMDDSRPGDPAVLISGRRFPYTPADPRSLRVGNAAGADSGPKPLKAPMPGRVVRVLVAVGDTVEAGQGCVVIEAMKMQNELKAPRAGVVARLAAVVGETVAANAVLLVVE